MKGLKKIALVSAIAASSSFAQAELKSLDDSAMGDLTGQAGISIELNTNVDIGAIVYTDTDTGGKLVMSNIAIGGAGNAYGTSGADVNLDDVLIDIDIAADGDAVIDIHHKSGEFPLDFGLDVGQVALVSADNTENTVLLSGINLDGMIVDHIAIRVDTATDTLNINTGFVVMNLEANVDFLAVGVTGGMIGALDTDWTAVAAATDTAGVVAALAGAGVATGGVTNKGARVDVTVGTGLNAAGATALQIDVNEFGADIYMAGITIGGTSIGSVLINDLVVRNTSMVVYGH